MRAVRSAAQCGLCSAVHSAVSTQHSAASLDRRLLRPACSTTSEREPLSLACYGPSLCRCQAVSVRRRAAKTMRTRKAHWS